MRAPLILGMCLLGSVTARAQDAPRAFYDGNSLYEVCQGKHPQQQGFCSGYAAAIVDSLSSVAAQLNSCTVNVPMAVSVSQVRDVMINYLRDHPEDRHFSAFSLTTAALKEKFPCK